MKAIHNKDYSVVKTFKAGELAFFHFKNVILAPSKTLNDFFRIYTKAPAPHIP